MSAFILAGTIFVTTLGGILLGTLLRRTLPRHHLNEHAKDVVRLGVGLIAAIAALVLSLLIGAAKGSFDTQTTQVKQITANLILLDNILSQYGPEARPDPPAHAECGRAVCRSALAREASAYERSIPTECCGGGGLFEIQKLSPSTDVQRSLQSRAVQVSNDLAQLRFMLFVESESFIPTPFLGILALWLVIVFASYSLFSPLNVTLFTCLSLFAFSAACAIFLILELGRPFTGLMMVSSAPLRNALGTL